MVQLEAFLTRKLWPVHTEHDIVAQMGLNPYFSDGQPASTLDSSGTHPSDSKQ